MRKWTWAAIAFLAAGSAAADGGRVRLTQNAGPFTVTVFTAPEPLTSGPADISVLVQDRGDGRVLLDAAVVLELRAPGGSAPRRIPARVGTNRLLKVCLVRLESEGAWDAAVVVRRAGSEARVSLSLPVAAAPSRLAAVWPLLLIPPLAAVWLFGSGRRRPIRRESSLPSRSPRPDRARSRTSSEAP
jgi:hypothetical protein